MHSVATVMTDVFQKNGIMVLRKLAKITRIFVDMGHIKNQVVIYWPKRIRPVIPMLWSSHNFGQKYMTSQLLMCPMSTNILMILANFLDTIIPFF
jgi:uncharacterized membrane protein